MWRAPLRPSSCSAQRQPRTGDISPARSPSSALPSTTIVLDGRVLFVFLLPRQSPSSRSRCNLCNSRFLHSQTRAVLHFPTAALPWGGPSWTLKAAIDFVYGSPHLQGPQGPSPGEEEPARRRWGEHWGVGTLGGEGLWEVAAIEPHVPETPETLTSPPPPRKRRRCFSFIHSFVHSGNVC